MTALQGRDQDAAAEDRRSTRSRSPVPEDDLSFPSVEDVVDDLKRLRQRGLLRCASTDLPALSALAVRRGLAQPPNRDNVGVERVLREAVARLGDEESGRAVRYLFGLVRGTVGRRPTDLREAAAREYGRLSPQSFRKRHEPLLLHRVAEEMILALPVATRRRAEPAGAAERGIHAHLEALGWDIAQGAPTPLVGRFGPYPVRIAAERASQVVVDCGAVEELSDVHVIVSSENTYLMPARPFSSSLSGSLRKAAEVRGPDGSLMDDVIPRQLRAWLESIGRAGGPVEPGVVASTSPGNLARMGVVAILHAAVAVPRHSGTGYEVDRSVVSRAVARCFEIGRGLRRDVQRPVESMSFPLFGAGHAGVSASRSAAWLWPAVHRELLFDPSWRIHLTAWDAVETRELLAQVAAVADES